MIKHACKAVNKKIPKAFRQADFHGIVSTGSLRCCQCDVSGLGDLPGSYFAYNEVYMSLLTVTEERDMLLLQL